MEKQEKRVLTLDRYETTCWKKNALPTLWTKFS